MIGLSNEQKMEFLQPEPRFCIPDIVGLRIIMSSAYMTMPVNIPCTVLSTIVSFSNVGRSSFV